MPKNQPIKHTGSTGQTIYQGTIAQINHLFKQQPINTDDDLQTYRGFDLVTPVFFKNRALSFEHGCQYLIQTDQNGHVSAVLKFKRYSLPLHNYVAEQDANNQDTYVAIRLIDVRADLRQTGLAKQLIHFWGTTVLRPSDVVVGGRATQLGQQTAIHSWLDRELPQRYVTSEIELVNDWLEEHEYDD